MTTTFMVMGTLVRVQLERHQCGALGGMVSLISRDPDVWCIRTGPADSAGLEIVRFCPWCGTKLQSSAAAAEREATCVCGHWRIDHSDGPERTPGGIRLNTSGTPWCMHRDCDCKSFTARE